jgi:hypothetical protein
MTPLNVIGDRRDIDGGGPRCQRFANTYSPQVFSSIGGFALMLAAGRQRGQSACRS